MYLPIVALYTLTHLNGGGCLQHRSRYGNFLRVKLQLISYPSIKTCFLSGQKNRLHETVLLSTHNTCFG